MFKSHIKLIVMKHLNQKSSSGYDLMKYFSQRGKKVSPGYLYPLLEDLEKNGFISIKKNGRKKICSTTAKGKELVKNLEAKYREMVNIMETVGDKTEMKEFAELKAGMVNYQDLIGEKEKMWEIRKLIILSHKNNVGKKTKTILNETIRNLKKLNKDTQRKT